MSVCALDRVLASGSRWRATADFDLSPLREGDGADLLAHFADPRVVEFMDIDPVAGLDEAVAIVGWATSQRAAGHGVRLAIRDRASGAFVGTCGFNSLTLARGRRGEIAYDLGVAWWGRGVMGQILPHLIDMGFQALDLHRLEALVTPGNQRSCALLERHGFCREGLLRDHGFWKGGFQDQLLFARLVQPGEG